MQREFQYNVTCREKDKGWQVIISYKIGNKWRQKSKQGFSSKREAKSYSLELINEIKKQYDNSIFTNEEYKDITLRELKEIYKEDIKAIRSGNTLIQIDTSINAFKNLLDKRVVDIKKQDIQESISQMIYADKKFNTVKVRLTYLKILLKSAIKDYNIISVNVANDIELKKSMFKKDNVKIALTEKESQEVLDHFRGKKYYYFILVGLTCGLRIGEICALTLGDVDLEKCEIDVNKQLAKNKDGILSINKPKSSNSYRKVPIPQNTVRELKEYIEKKKITKKDDFLFRFEKDVKYSSVISVMLKKIRPDISFHTLRHTYITKLIQKGLDVQTIAYLAGHSVKMTMDIYSHVNNDSISKARKLIDEHF